MTPVPEPPPGAPSVEVTSLLRAPAEEVWAVATTMEGVNDELRPWLRMTAPAGAVLAPEAVAPGERVFRSWLLLLGFLPFDYDDLTFVRIGPGTEFFERSPLLSASAWEHHRVVEPAAGGCRVTDRVRFVPRVKAAAPLQRRIVGAVFRHRHRRLRRRFGAAVPGLTASPAPRP
jgi:ligand-binding SRPBCC domain-containing protein